MGAIKGIAPIHEEVADMLVQDGARFGIWFKLNNTFTTHKCVGSTKL